MGGWVGRWERGLPLWAGGGLVDLHVLFTGACPPHTSKESGTEFFDGDGLGGWVGGLMER